MKLLIRSAVLVSACALGLTTLPAPVPAAESATLTADVASSAFKPFEHLFKEYEKSHPGVTINPKSMSGNAIQADVEADNPAVDFVVVGKKQTDAVTAHINPPVQILTQKEAVLVPWSGAKVKSLKDLGQPGVKVALGTAESAVGGPARTLLKNAAGDAAYGADFPQKVRANTVFEGAKGTDMPDAVRSGRADAAIGFVSDEDPPHLRALTIPDNLNVATPYYVFVPKSSKNQKAADDLLKFINSKHGLAVLHSFHYLPPGK